MYKNKTIALITANKNRFESIDESISSWIQIPEIDKILIVDWSSEDATILQQKCILDDRIVVKRVENEPYFNHSKSKNLGVIEANTDIVMIIDSDIKLNKDIIKYCDDMFTDDSKYHRGYCNGGWGSVIINRESFMKVGGYDERFHGWGHSDDDLYERLINKSALRLPEIMLSHIDHPEENRVNQMFVKGREESQEYNRNIVKQFGYWTSKQMIDNYVLRCAALFKKENI